MNGQRKGERNHRLKQFMVSAEVHMSKAVKSAREKLHLSLGGGFRTVSREKVLKNEWQLEQMREGQIGGKNSLRKANLKMTVKVWSAVDALVSTPGNYPLRHRGLFLITVIFIYTFNTSLSLLSICA